MKPTILLMMAMTVAAAAAVSFNDGFDVPGNQLDLSAWTTEFGPPSFLGRTQLRDWVHDSDNGPFVVASGLAQLALNTFNPPSGGALFGTHAKTLTTFQPTPDLDYVLTVRMRLDSLQPGIVYAVYFYGCVPQNCASNHDELDIELLTNYLQPQTLKRIQLNRYAAEPLGAGHGPVVNLPGNFDPQAFHEWKIRWALDRVTYFLDGAELFSATTFIPQGSMHADIIAWAPSQDWPDAFDASLQPAANAQANQSFIAFVDSVSVTPVARKRRSQLISN